MNRRAFLRSSSRSAAKLIASVHSLTTSCAGPARPNPSDPRLERIWGQRGLNDGRFQKPRAIAINDRDELFIVDMTGRVQVFDKFGTFLRLWKTPEIISGKPTGLGVDRSGDVMVADTHYYRVLFYKSTGEPVPQKTLGGTNGKGPGEFGFVTDAVQDRQGNYYVSEYGEFDRIQKFTSNGEFVCQFGRHGDAPLEFNRPQALFLDKQDNLWIADACNHRVQVVRCETDKPELIQMWGTEGRNPGKLYYPYGLWVEDDETVLISEYGGCRVQRLSQRGEPIDSWGEPGRGPSQLFQPWSLVKDSTKRVHVLDSNNHRVQTVKI